MQDRFKFRVWSDKENKYLTNDDIWEMTDALVEDVWGLLGEIEDPTTEYSKQHLKDYRLTFEQCTGLKDKNGKLIYEGDIVEVPVLYNGIPTGKKQRCKVYYKHRAFNIYAVKSEYLKVIGNIYENPELLEKKDGRC